jgi:hypothetical protein
MDPIRVPLGEDTAAYVGVTEENYLSLRKAYRLALKRNLISFKWKDIGLVVSFAKYMLEYMEMDTSIITEAVKAEDDPEGDE